MKKFILSCLLAVTINGYCQQNSNPTLSAGIESLTLNKGSIDVELLTQIIIEKQKEIKGEALKRLLLELFPEDNYTTKFFVQNCLNILLYEKNPQVIKREILELTTNYALAMGFTYTLQRIESKGDTTKISPIIKSMRELKTAYSKSNKIDNSAYYPFDKETSKILNIQSKIEKESNLSKKQKWQKKLRRLILKNDLSEYEDIITLRGKLIHNEKIKDTSWAELEEYILDNNITEINNLIKSSGKKDNFFKRNLELYVDLISKETKIEEFPFQILLDLTATALSNSLELSERGFFKQKIDYKKSDFYYSNIDNSLLITAADTFISNLDTLINTYSTNYQMVNEFMRKVDKSDATDVYTSTIKLLENQTLFEFDNDILTILDDFLKEDKKDFKEIKQFVYAQIINQKISSNYPEIIDPQLISFAKSENSKYGILKDKIDKLNEKTKTISELNDRFEIYEPEFNNLDSIYNKIIEETKAWKEEVSRLEISINEYLKSLQELEKEEIIKKYNSVLSNLKEKQLDTINRLIAEKLISKIEKIKLSSNKRTDPTVFMQISEVLPEMYIVIKDIYEGKNPTVKDINLFEDELSKFIIQLNLVASNDDLEKLKSIIKEIRVLGSFIKIRKLKAIAKNSIKYYEEIHDLFEFVSNLDNLDQAETFNSLVNMMRNGNSILNKELPEGEFKNAYLTVINALKKYVVINTENNSLDLDGASFLVDLQNYYNQNNKSRWSLYLSLGVNQNRFIKDFTFPLDETNSTPETIRTIGFASEKLGISYKITDFKKFKNYENSIKSDLSLNEKTPFINGLYAIAYGSGLLYSIANTSTDSNFDYPHVGIGLGIRFYNALDVNFTYGLPFIRNRNIFDNSFVGIGLDIPLGEYLEKVGN